MEKFIGILLIVNLILVILMWILSWKTKNLELENKDLNIRLDIIQEYLNIKIEFEEDVEEND